MQLLTFCIHQQPATNEHQFALNTNSNYTPTLEKLLSSTARNSEVYLKRSNSHSEGFKFLNKNDAAANRQYYAAQMANDDVCNEISITPIEKRYSQEYKGNMLRTALHAVGVPDSSVTVLILK